MHTGEESMSDTTYKSIELIGRSDDSYESAIESAVERAASTMRNLQYFEVVNLRGRIEDGRVSQYQARIQAWFELDS